MPPKNNKIEKVCGPSLSFAGYAFIAGGLFALRYSLSSVILIASGTFIAFSYSGTLIDFERKRIKSYTSFFGILRFGKWTDIDSSFTFRITKSKRRYTTHSRANLTNSIYIHDLKLELVCSTTGRRILVNRHKSYEAASREMEELSENLRIDMKNE